MPKRQKKRRPPRRPPDPQPRKPLPPGKHRCAAITAKGARCRLPAADGVDHCPVHLGSKVGRPSKFDAESAKRIVEVLRAGGYRETAASVAGISRETLRTWLDRGDPARKRKEDAPYREFREQVEAAQAQGEVRNVALIATAAAKDWKAAAWMLERQYPDRWAGPRGRALRGTSLTDEPTLDGDGNTAGGWVDDQVGPDGRTL
jgi:hypothetical protein